MEAQPALPAIPGTVRFPDAVRQGWTLTARPRIRQMPPARDARPSPAAPRGRGVPARMQPSSPSLRSAPP